MNDGQAFSGQNPVNQAFGGQSGQEFSASLRRHAEIYTKMRWGVIKLRARGRNCLSRRNGRRTQFATLRRSTGTEAISVCSLVTPVIT